MLENVCVCMHTSAHGVCTDVCLDMCVGRPEENIGSPAFILSAIIPYSLSDPAVVTINMPQPSSSQCRVYRHAEVYLGFWGCWGLNSGLPVQCSYPLSNLPSPCARPLRNKFLMFGTGQFKLESASAVLLSST